jgi:hypothetical protein
MDTQDWLLETDAGQGTTVFMKLGHHTSKTSKEIFDRYASGEDFGFTKTVVPVRLAEYGDDKLISRSQAKRVLVRVELFKTVLFDFKGVDTIGHSFADEIFRVFALQHPGMDLIPIDMSEGVKQMVQRARTGSYVNGVQGLTSSATAEPSPEQPERELEKNQS